MRIIWICIYLVRGSPHQTKYIYIFGGWGLKKVEHHWLDNQYIPFVHLHVLLNLRNNIDELSLCIYYLKKIKFGLEEK